MMPKTAPEAPILMVSRPVPFQTDRLTRSWRIRKKEDVTTALGMRVLTLEVEDSRGTNSAMGEMFPISLDNYLEEDKELEWAIYSHNSLVEDKEVQIIEETISDMILP